jgi:RNA-directed DNA polymerase
MGMREPCVEGVAAHGVPESCAGVREGVGEALTGARAGWVIEPRNQWHWGADAVTKGGRQDRWQRYRELLVGPARSRELGHVRNLRSREQGGPMIVRRVDRWSGRTGNAEAERS